MQLAIGSHLHLSLPQRPMAPATQTDSEIAEACFPSAVKASGYHDYQL
jgi:hypothetical protein